AFCDYLAATGETAKSSKVEVLVDGQVRHTCDITPENLLTIDNTLEISELSDGEHTVTVRKSGDGPLYWNVYMKNFTLEEFIEKAGLEVKIERRYRLLTEDKEATADVVGGRGQALSQRVKKWNRTPLEATATVESGQLVEIELLIESKNDYDFILIEDPKAAGFEPVEQLSGYDGNTLGAYVEYRDDRVCFFVKKLDRGRYSVTYQVRAEQPGNFSALPATILGMYAPELAGNSDENKVEVTDLPETPNSGGEQP
ncbi:MAG: alpha-2-macroglobulin, partial [Thermoguttaceae bacterium]|nr:alpha-2-macroglobulin [Thermoguttaceae bacterium]